MQPTKIEFGTKWRINNEGILSRQGTTPKVFEIFGNQFPSFGITIRTPYRSGMTRTVNFKATNIRVRNPVHGLLSDKNKCNRGIPGAQFTGGQVDTGHIITWRYVNNGVEVLSQALIVGKMISPGIEFINGQTVYISEDEGNLFTNVLLGVAAPQISSPRILAVERLDGGDVNENGSLSIPNYFCTIDREPTSIAGADLAPKIPSTSARNGTALWLPSTDQFNTLSRNQSGDWSLEAT